MKLNDGSYVYDLKRNLIFIRFKNMQQKFDTFTWGGRQEEAQV